MPANTQEHVGWLNLFFKVVPFWHGQELFLALEQLWRSEPFWVEGAGHNNIEALLRPTGAFVDKLVGELSRVRSPSTVRLLLTSL